MLRPFVTIRRNHTKKFTSFLPATMASFSSSARQRLLRPARRVLLPSEHQQQLHLRTFSVSSRPAAFVPHSSSIVSTLDHRRPSMATDVAYHTIATRSHGRRTLSAAAAPPNQTEKSQQTTTPEEAAASGSTTASSTTESFADTIHRLSGTNQRGDSTDSNRHNSSSSSSEEVFRHAASWWDKLQSEVQLAWKELLASGQRKDINKKITVAHPHATAEGNAPYTGPVELVVIDPSENLTAWERMQKRLNDTPIIADMLQRTEKLYETSGAKQVKEKVDHLREDAKEAWETSQNPWVYRISSVYDTITAETPESMAVKELRVLDPEFTLDDWRQDVVEHTLPQIMTWFLEGRINQLKPWLGESVFKRIAAEITARQQEGVEIDTHVLGIMNSEILAVEPDEVERGSPIILLHFMVQQINCTRKKKDGSIVEGSEDDIRANSYVAAFQREYNEEKGELNWKIVDFRFNGAIAYL